MRKHRLADGVLYCATVWHVECAAGGSCYTSAVSQPWVWNRRPGAVDSEGRDRNGSNAADCI